MLTLFGKALICNHAETGEPVLLAASSTAEDVETIMQQYRTLFTHCAAAPGIAQDDYEKMMGSIRSMKIVSVRVTETEDL